MLFVMSKALCDLWSRLAIFSFVRLQPPFIAFFTVFLLASVVSPLSAQTNSINFLDASPPFNVTTGLSMTQDREGFLWIIDTWRLFKYDGYTYKRYYNGGYRLFDVPVGPSGLIGGEHRFICVTARVNKILFVDIDRNDQRILSLKESGRPGNHVISAAIEDSRGRFWVGCLGGDVFVVDPAELTVECILAGE